MKLQYPELDVIVPTPVGVNRLNRHQGTSGPNCPHACGGEPNYFYFKAAEYEHCPHICGGEPFIVGCFQQLSLGLQGLRLEKQDMPTEIQWIVFQDAIRSLGQMRYRLVDVYCEGVFLYLEVKSCEGERTYIYIIDDEGNWL